MVPLKTELNGNAPNMKKADQDKYGGEKGEDIIDETIKAFRINVLFKHFTREGKRSYNLNNLFIGNADVTLFYLTVYMQHCISKLRNGGKPMDMDKAMAMLKV